MTREKKMTIVEEIWREEVQPSVPAQPRPSRVVDWSLMAPAESDSSGWLAARMGPIEQRRAEDEKRRTKQIEAPKAWAWEPTVEPSLEVEPIAVDPQVAEIRGGDPDSQIFLVSPSSRRRADRSRPRRSREETGIFLL